MHKSKFWYVLIVTHDKKLDFYKFVCKHIKKLAYEPPYYFSTDPDQSCAGSKRDMTVFEEKVRNHYYRDEGFLLYNFNIVQFDEALIRVMMHV